MKISDYELYSMNEETYYDCDQCVYDYCEEFLNKGDVFTLYCANKREFNHTDFLHPYELGNIVDGMQERAYEIVGEVAEIYLQNLATNENEQEFKEIVSTWIHSKLGDVNIFGVKDCFQFTCVWDGNDWHVKE